jgi:hypothetical protein
MVSLQQGTFAGKVVMALQRDCAIICYNLVRYRHTTVMLACIIMDTLSTFHQTLHSGTMQRVRRLTEQAAPPTEHAPFVVTDITEGFGMIFLVRVGLHARGQGLPGSTRLLGTWLRACLAPAVSFRNTLQISSPTLWLTSQFAKSFDL